MGRSTFPPMTEQGEWVAETDKVSGLTSEVAKFEWRPEKHSGGVFLYAGWGWAVYTVDRPDDGEWLVVTDSGTVADFISEEDARGMLWVSVRRFDSASAREAWLAAKRQEMGNRQGR